MLRRNLGLVSIKDTTEKNVVVDRERSNIDGKSPGDYTYPRGTTLSGFIKIVNKDAQIARARALVYDEANAEEIWVSEEKDLYANQVIQGDFTVKVDKDRRITMYAQYYDPIRDMWRTGDIYGSWELQFREAPEPTGEPDFEIMSFEVPSTARPGETITATVTVKNNGGRGECKVELGYYDGISDKRIETVTLISGGRHSTSMDIKIPEDYQESYLNVYCNVYHGETKQDHKLVTIKVFRKPSEGEPTEGEETEKPTQLGNVVVTAILKQPAFRGILVAFYKGGKQIKSGTLKQAGDRISVEVEPKTLVCFAARKRFSPLSAYAEGAAEQGETTEMKTFTYAIEIRNMITSKG